MKIQSQNLVSNLQLPCMVGIFTTKGPYQTPLVCQCRENRALRECEFFLKKNFPLIFYVLWLTLHQSYVNGKWRFRDGVFIDDELGILDIEEIRAACSQQSRSQWTTIASWDRLYQFLAMSDEDSQRIMRQTVCTTADDENLVMMD